ncbi:hypothetical protein TNCV_506011 [Trichonephila clavipes]|nr:hypothetical protein TNCV_506011 [Trichonephila clavipes]
MLIQPASSQPGLVRGTVVLVENSITVWIAEQHKRVEVITQQLYVLIYIKISWYTHQKSQTAPGEKTPQTVIELPCPCTVQTWLAGSMA